MSKIFKNPEFVSLVQLILRVVFMLGGAMLAHYIGMSGGTAIVVGWLLCFVYTGLVDEPFENLIKLMEKSDE